MTRDKLGEGIRVTRRPSPATRHNLHIRLGFAEAGDAVAVLPLAALFEKFGALKALEDIALAAERGRRAQTAML